MRLAIPGGSALAALAEARRRMGPVWSRVRLTWVDERCVPFAHPESNRGRAHRSGALSASHPPLRELPLFLDGEDGSEAARRAADGLTAHFDGGLDVLLLGMGADGHIASLFPGCPTPGTAHVAFVPASPRPPSQRVTLTLATLRTATRCVLIAAGPSKRGALRRLLAGDPTLPATGLRGLTVVSDESLVLAAARPIPGAVQIAE